MLECEHFCILSTSSCQIQIDDIQYDIYHSYIYIWWKKRGSLNMVTCSSKFLIFMPQRLKIYIVKYYCFGNFCLSLSNICYHFQGFFEKKNAIWYYTVLNKKRRFIWILCSYYCENFVFVKRSNWSKFFIIIFLFRTWLISYIYNAKNLDFRNLCFK